VHIKLSFYYVIALCFFISNKSAIILLLKTVNSLMGIWNCGIMNDCAGTEDKEH
jgi:hypothetical protein